MLPYAEVHVASRPVLRLEVPGPIHVRVGAGSKIGRASDHFGQMRSQNLDRLSRSDAGCHWAVRRSERREVIVPPLRKLTVHDSLKLRGEVRVFLSEGFQS